MRVPGAQPFHHRLRFMREPTLFDTIDETGADAATSTQPVVTTASAETAASADPPGQPSSADTKLRPVEHLARTLASEGTHIHEADYHPRDDKLWLSRDGAAYSLSVRRGRHVLRLSDTALRQLAGLLDVPMTLLSKLAGLPRVEDCRLLNMLLWAEGAKPDLRYRVRMQGDDVVAIHSAAFTVLDTASLARRLEEAEAEGLLRVRRYTSEPGGLWIEVEHMGLSAIDVSPITERANSKADLWRPGAVLWNEEDGGRAVTVFPALFRDWGGLVLPVVPSVSDLRKRRHAHTSPDALLRGALGDLTATRQAPFAEVAQKLMALHQRYLPNSGVQAFLDGLALPFPTKRCRDAVVRRVITGRATAYRVVAAVLREAPVDADLARRFRLELAMGRYVWSGVTGRSNRRSRRFSARGGSGPRTGERRVRTETA